METGRIKLMRHHLEVLVRDRLPPKKGFVASIQKAVARVVGDAVYGGEHRKYRRKRIMSLPENTVVELVADRDATGRTNIDYVCESDCPYIKFCASGASPRSAMRKRAGILYNFFTAAVPLKREENNVAYKSFPPGVYVLEDLVQKAIPYFNR